MGVEQNLHVLPLLGRALEQVGNQIVIRIEVIHDLDFAFHAPWLAGFSLDEEGLNTAIGFPALPIMTVSPRATRSMIWERLVLASCTLIVFMPAIYQKNKLSQLNEYLLVFLIIPADVPRPSEIPSCCF
jgi:hypothetical protein